jgi:hypothetical protein
MIMGIAVAGLERAITSPPRASATKAYPSMAACLLLLARGQERFSYGGFPLSLAGR